MDKEEQMAGELDRVVPLDELDDFKVAEGDPDVRGWDVLSADGRKIGEVDNLLIDTAAMKVRYLEVDVDRDVLDASDERHVLVPIGYARLDEDDDQVRVDSLNSTDVMALPAYRREPLTREYETSVRKRFDSGYTAAKTNEDFYEDAGYDQDRFFGARRSEGETRIPVSEEQLAIGKRERQAGEVEIDKDVETRHVRENVPTRHEEVVVERRPATEGMSAKPRIEEDEIHVPVTEEELVVQKRTVPKEEVVVKKREVVENETVEADLRRERVDVHSEGDVRLRKEGDTGRER
jgi:uncharacterized protein (TIGR02271 family)